LWGKIGIFIALGSHLEHENDGTDLIVANNYLLDESVCLRCVSQRGSFGVTLENSPPGRGFCGIISGLRRLAISAILSLFPGSSWLDRVISIALPAIQHGFFSVSFSKHSGIESKALSYS
jgi:hypothetical protein